MNDSRRLCYSRVEVAVNTRHSARCCGHPPLLRCNKVVAVRSARRMGKDADIRLFVILQRCLEKGVGIFYE